METDDVQIVEEFGEEGEIDPEYLKFVQQTLRHRQERECVERLVRRECIRAGDAAKATTMTQSLRIGDDKHIEDTQSQGNGWRMENHVGSAIYLNSDTEREKTVDDYTLLTSSEGRMPRFEEKYDYFLGLFKVDLL
jgi:hypothetical protein